MRVSEQHILEIAKAIMRDSPGTTPQKALRHAKDVYKNRGIYKVAAEEKQTSEERTAWNRLPPHVRETIRKQQKAEEERSKHGRELPSAHFFSGGKVSPK